MSLRGFFEGVQEFAEATLFAPFNALAELELSNWWLANGVNWIFMLICAAAIVYWIMEIKKYDANDTEYREAKAHGFLGKNSELESNL
ncbi:hypothetical protein MED134_09446 [Dokdonia sp. MED134]|jgi:hypothetical protein|uniref:DUF6341 family protein n=1 Tax=Dokdonia sp. MED134 TaxID=313590 RepID=UPI000068CECB|nr:hypothetical protein [Dokdonia sp. MED134]EAQ39706.1 hypothetical protein MED134_09446 [Dokdonia sp. MED134]